MVEPSTWQLLPGESCESGQIITDEIRTSMCEPRRGRQPLRWAIVASSALSAPRIGERSGGHCQILSIRGLRLSAVGSGEPSGTCLVPSRPSACAGRPLEVAFRKVLLL